jgi:hypothetical protein
VCVAAVPTNADPDLWGNLRFGLDILETWHIDTVDAYSFTQDQPWINHEWLAQVLMVIAYRAGGTPGLVTLKLTLVVTTLWLVRGAWRSTKALLPEGAALLVLWGALPMSATLRAQLWSFLLLAVLCRLLDGRTAHLPAVVPLVFAIWVNLHMGWVVGLAVLTWWALGEAVHGSAVERRRAAVVLGLSLLATLLNPYGWRLWDFALGVTHLSRRLQEWQPLWSSPPINWVPWFAAAAAVVVAMTRGTRPSFERVASLAGLAYASVQVVKFAPLFVELTVLLLAPLARQRWPAAAGVRTPAIVLRRANAAALALIAVAAAWTSWPRLQCLPAGDWRPDATVARALLDVRATGRMAVWFDWGEYVIWHFGPALKVSFDPRYDLVYSPETIAEQEDVARGAPRGIAFLARTRPEYVWYPQSKGALKEWVAGNGYRIDIDTRESFLAVRMDLGSVSAPPPQVFGCFPAP